MVARRRARLPEPTAAASFVTRFESVCASTLVVPRLKGAANSATISRRISLRFLGFMDALMASGDMRYNIRVRV